MSLNRVEDFFIADVGSGPRVGPWNPFAPCFVDEYPALAMGHSRQSEMISQSYTLSRFMAQANNEAVKSARQPDANLRTRSEK
jgi:hypothetical protein